MKRRILSILPTILFLGLLTALVSVRSATSAQSIHSMAVEPGYLAQYSTDGENWYTLADADSLPKTDSHILYLRMSFLSDRPEGLNMSFYLNHLFFSMAVRRSFPTFPMRRVTSRLGICAAPNGILCVHRVSPARI